MTTSAQIIEQLGGTVAVARELDLPPSTVSSWKSSRIPKWRMPGIQAMADRLNVNLSDVPADNATGSAASPGKSDDFAAQQSEAA